MHSTKDVGASAEGVRMTKIQWAGLGVLIAGQAHLKVLPGVLGGREVLGVRGVLALPVNGRAVRGPSTEPSCACNSCEQLMCCQACW